MNKEIKTQVVVLGAGPAGYSAAFRCADLGLQTVIVERFSTVNRGQMWIKFAVGKKKLLIN